MKKTAGSGTTFSGILLLLVLTSGVSLRAQDTLTLEACYRMVEQTFPLAAQPAMLTSNSALKIQNLNKSWLPVITLNGQLSYQSDVTKVEISLPSPLPSLDMPELSKDWYKATLDVNQTIWDGNVTSFRKRVEEMELQVDQTSVQAELYRVKVLVNRFFFSIILLNHNEALLLSTRQQLESKRNEVMAGIRYGAVLQSTADALDAELLGLEQKLTETRIDRNGLISMLGELTSSDIPDAVILITPDPVITDFTYRNQRPENTLFDLQKEKLGLLQQMITTTWNPKFMAFGQAGIGRPGLNMLSNDPEPFYMIGIRMNWPLINWNTNKNEKKILGIRSDILSSQQEAFDKTQKIESEKELSEILKTMEVIKQDQEIILLREKISQSASAQLSNGVITASEYVMRLTEERQARLAHEIHRIKLVEAKLAYLYQQGKL